MDILPRLNFTSGLLLPIAKRQLSWDGQANSNVLVLAKAGHRSGLYLVTSVVVVRTAPGAGIVDRAISFDAPALPGQVLTLASPYGVASGIGIYGAQDSACVPSDGTADLSVQFVPAGIVPPAEIDVYACAVILNRRS